MQLPPGDGDERTPLTSKALAATYATPGQATPWDAVEQYQRVMDVASRNPNAGSAALSTKLDLPRGRIRPWLNGSVPDVVRGLSIAHKNGWFEPDAVIPWASLVVGILGGGSIGVKFYQPEWTTIPEEPCRRIMTSLEELGVGHSRTERSGRPDYLRPDKDISVLGRALVALGAPTGHKNADSEPLPEWLLSAPLQARVNAVKDLLLYRGQGYEDKDTVSLYETRSQTFRESVARLISSVVDGAVSPGERYIIISAAAARELGVGRNGHLRSALEANE